MIKIKYLNDKGQQFSKNKQYLGTDGKYHVNEKTDEGKLLCGFVRTEFVTPEPVIYEDIEDEALEEEVLENETL